MQSISRHEISKRGRSASWVAWFTSAPHIGSGGSTRSRVAAASMSQISRPLWMLERKIADPVRYANSGGVSVGDSFHLGARISSIHSVGEDIAVEDGTNWSST